MPMLMPACKRNMQTPEFSRNPDYSARTHLEIPPYLYHQIHRLNTTIRLTWFLLVLMVSDFIKDTHFRLYNSDWSEK
jgi:hypothetical protein